MPVVALSQDRMVSVRYIGKGANYTASTGPKNPGASGADGKPRTFKFVSPKRGGVPLEVPLRLWNHLRKQRNPEGLREFALVGGIDKEVLAQDRSQNRVGEFMTKRAAMEYAADQHNVQLLATLPLEQMNAISKIIKERASVGYKDENLVEGLKGAILMEAEEVVEEVAPEPVKPRKPVRAEDDDDETAALMDQLEEDVDIADGPEPGEIDTAAQPIAPARGKSVRKPQRISQM